MNEDGEEEEEAKVSLMDVFKFPAQFWLVTIICVLFYASVFPFVAIALPYYQSVFGLSPAEAAALNSIIYIMSAPLGKPFDIIFSSIIFQRLFSVLSSISSVSTRLGSSSQM